MGFIKKTASIVSSLIIILAIGGFVFVRNFDLNKYKPYVEEAVKKAKEVTKKICVMSPAAPSYNAFKNFEEKGRAYKNYIKEG